MDVSFIFIQFFIRIHWISSACIDTTQQGDLDQCQCLTNYVDSHQFAIFSPIGLIHHVKRENDLCFLLDMVTYSVQIHHEINILEIVVAGGRRKSSGKIEKDFN